eukprot:734117-Prymnesium_polylepis.1
MVPVDWEGRAVDVADEVGGRTVSIPVMQCELPDALPAADARASRGAPPSTSTFKLSTSRA